MLSVLHIIGSSTKPVNRSPSPTSCEQQKMSVFCRKTIFHFRRSDQNMIKYLLF